MAINRSATPQGMPQPTVRGYEASDAPVKWIFIAIGLLFAFALVVHFGIAWQLRGLRRRPQGTDQWTAARLAARAPVKPPKGYPLLQLSPPADMEAFRVKENAELSSYGWLDKTSGVVRAIGGERQLHIRRSPQCLLEKFIAA